MIMTIYRKRLKHDIIRSYTVIYSYTYNNNGINIMVIAGNQK